MRTKYHTTAFIITVLAVSWLIQVVIFTKMVPANLMLLYMFIPAIIGFIFYFLDKAPWQKQVQLFTRGLNFRSIAFAALYPFLWFIVVAAVALILGIGKLNLDFLPTLTSSSYLLSYIIVIITSLPIMFGEEYGWRGYLLPTLTEQHGKIRAVIIVGIVWGLWHVPSYYIAYSSMNIGNPILLTLIGVAVGVVASFPYAYCFYLARGNILPCVLIHSVYDVTAAKIFFSTPAVAGFTEGTPGLLTIKWPYALSLILLVGLAFVFFFIRQFRKMKSPLFF
ncbi:MAG: CPBP family intramembrane glutamic endopeptidase [Candidatus Margulisiibacteriota bacterium]